jgi:hypothetical protein
MGVYQVLEGGTKVLARDPAKFGEVPGHVPWVSYGDVLSHLSSRPFPDAGFPGVDDAPPFSFGTPPDCRGWKKQQERAARACTRLREVCGRRSKNAPSAGNRDRNGGIQKRSRQARVFISMFIRAVVSIIAGIRRVIANPAGTLPPVIFVEIS